MEEIVSAAQALDQDTQVKALIITGEGTKAFAAGADIKEMASQDYSEACPLLHGLHVYFVCLLRLHQACGRLCCPLHMLQELAKQRMALLIQLRACMCLTKTLVGDKTRTAYDQWCRRSTGASWRAGRG